MRVVCPPADIQEAEIPESGRVDEFLVLSGVCGSRSEARRLIRQGAVWVLAV